MSTLHEIEAAVRRPGETVVAGTRCLALLHGAACVDRFDVVSAMVALAPRLGIAPVRLHEAALQVVAYGGFPRAIETLGALAGPAPEEAADRAPGPAAGGAQEVGTVRAARGIALFEAVYGDQAGPVRRSLERLSPGLSRWVVEDAYGRVLARDGLDVAERELLAVAALALMGLAAPLDSHVRGALRNGSTAPAVIDILDTCRVLAGPQGLSLIGQLRARLLRTPPDP